MRKHDFRATSRLYVLHCCGYHKIGIARNVVRRIGELQVGNPFPIDLVFETPCLKAEKRERYWHAQFAHVRHSGEWFRLSEADIRRLKCVESNRNRGVGMTEDAGMNGYVVVSAELSLVSRVLGPAISEEDDRTDEEIEEEIRQMQKERNP